MTPPRGYNAVSVSGLVAFEVEGHKEQLPFGFGDLQVRNSTIIVDNKSLVK